MTTKEHPVADEILSAPAQREAIEKPFPGGIGLSGRNRFAAMFLTLSLTASPAVLADSDECTCCYRPEVVSNPALAKYEKPREDMAITGGGSLGQIDFRVSGDSEIRADFDRALGLLHHMMYVQARNALEAYQQSDAIWPERRNTLLGAARAAQAIGDEQTAQHYFERLQDISRDSQFAARSQSSR